MTLGSFFGMKFMVLFQISSNASLNSYIQELSVSMSV